MTRRALHPVICCLALAAVLTSLLALAGCGSDAMDGYSRYEDPKNGFAIQHPEDWEPLHGTGALVTFMAPAEPGTAGRANVTVTMEPVPASMTAAEYLEQAKPLLAQMLPEYEFGGQEPVTVGGVEGIRYSYTIEIQGHRMSLIGYALLAKGHAYVLTAGSLADRFDKHAETFDTICRSMEIL